MHSSRMRTGRALTVSGGGGGLVHPRRIFLGGGRKLKKKRKKNFGDPPKIWRTPSKNWRPPENLETPENLEDPPKIWRPPNIWRHPPTRKFGEPPGTRPPHAPVDRILGHMLLKILPWPNFVAAGIYSLNLKGP